MQQKALHSPRTRLVSEKRNLSHNVYSLSKRRAIEDEKRPAVIDDWRAPATAWNLQ